MYMVEGKSENGCPRSAVTPFLAMSGISRSMTFLFTVASSSCTLQMLTSNKVQRFIRGLCTFAYSYQFGKISSLFRNAWAFSSFLEATTDFFTMTCNIQHWTTNFAYQIMPTK